MQLVACSNCHTQYDVSRVAAKSIPCRCGEAVDCSPHSAVDAEIRRCGSCAASVGADATNCAYCGSAIVRDAGRLSLICPECFACCAQEARFCTACGVAFRPRNVRVEGHELPCPNCSALMPPREIAGIALNECLTCHGLWAPADGFDALVERAIDVHRGAQSDRLVARPRVTGSNPAAQRVQYRNCPECDGHMQRRNYRRRSGIIIDTCARHGSWLDADELEQIAGFIVSSGGGCEVPSAPERDAARAFALIQTRHAVGKERAEGGVVESLIELFSGMLR